MLPKYPIDEANVGTVHISFRKYRIESGARTDVTALGAFPKGAKIELEVCCPRAFGASAVVLRLAKDGHDGRDTAFAYAGSDDRDTTDCYRLTVDTAALLPDEASGLFYYQLLFIRRGDTLFSDSVNNVDFHLVSRGGAGFRLLIHTADYTVPAWLGEGVMYHMFVDRFCRGAGKVAYRTGERGAELNPDWAHGIPQYPEHPREPLTNHIHFGGNLWGVAEKLDYLEKLGVKVLYLSPIFEAYSNHKYDTGDYLTVDGGFGGEKAFRNLIDKAHEKGMKVILDGVFNHTGDDSRYFNRYGTYPSVGAHQKEDSPYHTWYKFQSFPDRYESWWGIPIMPRLNHQNEDCRRFFTGPNGVGAHYVRAGVDGWRLDVADELSDAFLDEFRTAVKGASDNEAVIIGEVWENAADKVAYGNRRRYLQGQQLDSVMNYPVRSGILAFVSDGDGEMLYHVLTELYASYPRCVSDSLMNLIGTHDTERILTVLGSEPADFDRSNAELSVARLSEERRELAIRRLKIAAALQFTVFGIPSVYYGDEVGMEGYHDPFCRFPFPWAEIGETPGVAAQSGDDQPIAYRLELLDYYRSLGALRADPAFKGGDFRILAHGEHHIVYERRAPSGDAPRYVIAANRGSDPVTVAVSEAQAEPVLTAGDVNAAHGVLTVGPDSVGVFRCF